MALRPCRSWFLLTVYTLFFIEEQMASSRTRLSNNRSVMPSNWVERLSLLSFKPSRTHQFVVNQIESNSSVGVGVTKSSSAKQRCPYFRLRWGNGMVGNSFTIMGSITGENGMTTVRSNPEVCREKVAPWTLCASDDMPISWKGERWTWRSNCLVSATVIVDIWYLGDD